MEAQTSTTNIKYPTNVSPYVTINGESISSNLSQDTNKNFVITFDTAPQSGQVVDYGLFYTTAKSFSATNVQTP